MNIVLVDSGQLAGDFEFPAINLPKFAWLEYVELPADEVGERCWRSDIIVSINTPISADVINETYKLKLIIAAGGDSQHIDKLAAKERGITICNVPGLKADNPQDAQKLCDQVVANIHAWLDNDPINVID